MPIPDELLFLYSAKIDSSDGVYRIHVPEREVMEGQLEPGEVYRVGLISNGEDAATSTSSTDSTDGRRIERQNDKPRNESSPGEEKPRSSDPPVEVGEVRTVEIVDTGDQGDGIAQLDRGFIVFVPDTEVGDMVSIEITHVKSNVAFAEVI